MAIQRTNEALLSDLKVPKYRQVIEGLLLEIRCGNFPVGSKLPPESELCEKFEVSRITVRKAMEYLEGEGMVSREAGRGTFVRNTAGNGAGQGPSMVSFLLIGVGTEDATEDEYNYQEIITTERFLSSRGIPFSWAAISHEDLLRGKYPVVLEKGMCSGLILDGQITDAHRALSDQFGVKLIAVGNHAISADFPQVRSRIRKAFLETIRVVLSRRPRRVVLAIEPMVLHFSTEVLRAYEEAVQEAGQDEMLVYLCPGDEPSSALARSIQNPKEDWVVVTTEVIYRKLALPLGFADTPHRPEFIVLRGGLNQHVFPKTWLVVPRAREMQVLAAERLLQLIDGTIQSVHEELECDVIPPQE